MAGVGRRLFQTWQGEAVAGVVLSPHRPVVPPWLREEQVGVPSCQAAIGCAAGRLTAPHPLVAASLSAQGAAVAASLLLQVGRGDHAKVMSDLGTADLGPRFHRRMIRKTDWMILVRVGAFLLLQEGLIQKCLRCRISFASFFLVTFLVVVAVARREYLASEEYQLETGRRTSYLGTVSRRLGLDRRHSQSDQQLQLAQQGLEVFR